MIYKTLFIGFSLLFNSASQASPSPQFKNVVIVIFENAKYSDALKQSFFAEVAGQGALFTQFIAEAHPSQPNYIALVAGDTLGVHNDSNVNLDSKHIGNLLEAKGLSWKVYAENLPSNCFLGASQGRYVRKHVPFYSFLNVQQDPNECKKIVSSNQFKIDLSSGTLPSYSLYIPNLDNDGHDTGAAYASKWFSTSFREIFSDPILMRDTLFIATFDESDNLIGKNQVYTVLLGANVIPDSQVTAVTNHYSLLRTIEDTLGIGTLGLKDSTIAPITGIWK